MDKKPYFIDVDGVQVFSADFVFQQMQAAGARIDRARNFALCSALLSTAAIVIAVIF